MCESGLEEKYKALVQGKTILESSLHNNLSEHLNSEICLGTITDTESAKTWLRSSFLYQRMRRNPQYYALNPGDDWKAGEVVDEVVMNSIAQLKQTLLIEKNEEEPDSKRLSCTEYGEIMSKVGAFVDPANPISSIIVLHPSSNGKQHQFFHF